MIHLPKLFVASHNAGKLREIRDALDGLVGAVVSQGELRGAPAAAEETADTYRGNALLKARALFELTHAPTMADDSGLEVEALGGRPGLQSARSGTGDLDRIEKLLAALAELPAGTDRRARFVCVVALLMPGHPPLYFEGTCPGSILSGPRGSGGFGFDPVFLLHGGELSMAELPLAQKNRVSHRARALAAMRRWLQESPG